MNAVVTPKRHPLDEDILLTTDDAAAMREQWVAMERLYRTEAPHLARYFARRVPAFEVGDFIQESFRRILGHRAERPGAFLQRTAANLVTEFRRTSARRQAMAHDSYEEGSVSGPDPIDALEARDAIARVQTVLNGLNPKTRNIFLLSRIEGKTYAEIAGLYGMSEEGVKKRVAKAMHVLRRKIGDL
jgi:RNA polymerase sigma-70 factor (ECF subfamily)